MYRRLLISFSALLAPVFFASSASANLTDDLLRAARQTPADKLSLVAPFEEASRVADDALSFVSRNKSSLMMTQINDIGDLLAPTATVHKILKGLGRNGGKSILVEAIAQSSDTQHECDITTKQYKFKDNTQYTRYTMTCNASVYGTSHWAPQNQRVNDTFWVLNSVDGAVIDGFEFGLIKTYIESMDLKIIDIKSKINEQII